MVESGHQWLSLGAACRMLAVNGSTLRQWADKGMVQVYRTPGGHRRFSRGDLQDLLEGRRGHRLAEEPSRWEEQALQRIRRRLHRAQDPFTAWQEKLDETARTRMRLFGRRLLHVATDLLNRRRRRAELLEEAWLLGQEHGREMVRRGLSLSEVVQAFVFFRNSLLEDAHGNAEAGGRGAEMRRVYQQVNPLADQVLLALVDAYDGASSAP